MIDPNAGDVIAVALKNAYPPDGLFGPDWDEATMVVLHALEERGFSVVYNAEGMSEPGAAAEGHAHRDAKKAEQMAARAQFPKSGTDRMKCLLALSMARRNGLVGLTDDELAKVTKLYRYTAAPRRKELVDGGWVEDTGKTLVGDRGRPQTIWRITERGAEEVERRRLHA